MIDILIMGSSRPQLIPYMWESFKRMCIIRQPYRVFFHEDFAFPSTSAGVRKMLQDMKRNKSITDFVYHNPAIGLGPAMDRMFKKYVTADYMLYLQEDWEFERPVDIDKITWMMDQNKDVNLVYFNKYRTTVAMSGFTQQPVNKSGVNLCLSNSWPFLPGIWKMPFVRPRWRTRKNNPESWFTQVFEGRENAGWCRKNMGAYIYGKQGEHRYVRHIGNSWRMARWRLEGGHPGGMIEWDVQDLPQKAPWIPLTPDVPLNKKVGIKEYKFIEMLKKQTPETQKALKGYLELAEVKKDVGRSNNKLK